MNTHGVMIHGRVQVVIHGRVQVVIHGCVQVVIHGRVQVVIHGCVQVVIHGHVQVVIYGCVQVVIHGRVQVVIHGRVQVVRANSAVHEFNLTQTFHFKENCSQQTTYTSQQQIISILVSSFGFHYLPFINQQSLSFSHADV